MKIYVNKVNESWIIDRIRKDWYKNKKNISTNNIRKSDIVWVLSPWVWQNLSKKILEQKKVICSHYHFDFDNFDEKDFYLLDRYVDEYHVISQKTYQQLRSLTDKKITSIPFWVDQNIFKNLPNKDLLRKNLDLSNDDYLIGSFQRDTESKDLISPKLIKGPDIFIDLVKKLYKKNKNVKVILAGKNRQYVIRQLKSNNIPFRYFQMVNLTELNELYNVLDLYLVTSRIEGGPQAIMEAAISKTPILSTDVGVASEILHSKSIFNRENFENSKVNTEFAHKKSLEFTIPRGINKFEEMLRSVYES
jgi:glycosyltransferase involved in cell wall biosynthesis